MGSWDIKGILQVGVTGLGFLLAFLTYLLIKTKPSKPHSTRIYAFMAFSFLLCLLGLISPLIGSGSSRDATVSGDPKSRSLSELLPNASRLLDPKGSNSHELATALNGADDLLFSSEVLRKDWVITLTYDTSHLVSEGVIAETVKWSYELINVGSVAHEYPMALAGVEEEAILKSFRVSVDDNSSWKIFDLCNVTAADEASIKTCRDHLSILPHKRYKLEMTYWHKWYVNPNHPLIDNSFAPGETSIGFNTVTINGPVKKAEVLYRNLPIKPRDTDQRIFDLSSPMLRFQDIELILKF